MTDLKIIGEVFQVSNNLLLYQHRHSYIARQSRFPPTFRSIIAATASYSTVYMNCMSTLIMVTSCSYTSLTSNIFISNILTAKTEDFNGKMSFVAGI